MIMVTDTRAIIEGNEPTVLNDFCHVVRGVYEGLVEHHGEEEANEMLAFLGQLALCKNEEEADKATAESLQRLLDIKNNK